MKFIKKLMKLRSMKEPKGKFGTKWGRNERETKIFAYDRAASIHIANTYIHPLILQGRKKKHRKDRPGILEVIENANDAFFLSLPAQH